MRVDLPDLGANFRAIGLDEGNRFDGRATDSRITLRPGTYLLTRAGVTTQWGAQSPWKNIRLGEIVAPPPSLDQTYVLHQPIVEATAGRNLRVTATVASPVPPQKVTLVAYPPPSREPQVVPTGPTPRVQPGGNNGPGVAPVDTGGAQSFDMQRQDGFDYSAEIPGKLLQPGTLRYEIAVLGPGGYTTFPAQVNAFPTDWDFYGEPWHARIVPAGAPILVFDAAADAQKLTADHRNAPSSIVPSERPGTSAVEVLADALSEGEHDYSVRYFFKDTIRGRESELATAREIVVYGASATDKPCPVQLALVTADGIAYGAVVTVQPQFGAYSVPVSALKPVRAPNIPHGYPVFIPFWSAPASAVALDLRRAESVLISIGPGLAPADRAGPHGLRIERIWLN
jgi:hypothetical protein